jgi:hypothetical protein
MSVEGDRKQSVDAKLKKQCFSYTAPNVFALNGRHLGFAPTGHAFDHSSQQSRSIISMGNSQGEPGLMACVLYISRHVIMQKYRVGWGGSCKKSKPKTVKKKPEKNKKSFFIYK